MPKDRNAVLEIYDRLIAEVDGLARKGKATAYTSMNGNMFSFVDGNGVLALRFSNEDLEVFNAEFGGGPVLQYGSVMRGYGAVPEALLKDEDRLKGWFLKSVAHVLSLKPKPTKR
jgi:hypothetical protein